MVLSEKTVWPSYLSFIYFYVTEITTATKIFILIIKLYFKSCQEQSPEVVMHLLFRLSRVESRSFDVLTVSIVQSRVQKF
jgi:hypothetical protein